MPKIAVRETTPTGGASYKWVKMLLFAIGHTIVFSKPCRGLNTAFVSDIYVFGDDHVEFELTGFIKPPRSRSGHTASDDAPEVPDIGNKLVVPLSEIIECGGEY